MSFFNNFVKHCHRLSYGLDQGKLPPESGKDGVKVGFPEGAFVGSFILDSRANGVGFIAGHGEAGLFCFRFWLRPWQGYRVWLRQSRGLAR